MGTDIGGVIEVRDDSASDVWRVVADLDDLYTSRSYDAFGALFGVRNYAGFTPIAEGRGLPAGFDKTATPDWTWGEDHTWVSWAELDAIDWDEKAARVDDRIHRYERDAGGAWSSRGKAIHYPELTDVLGPYQGPIGSQYPEGTQWQVGETLFRIERMTRRAAVRAQDQWKFVFDMMADLAQTHGGEGVRLTVWFDS